MPKPKHVNRSCLIVTPAEGYVKWARSLPDATGDEQVGDPDEPFTAYLIPEQGAGPEKWLRKNCKAIFEQELAFWCGSSAAERRRGFGGAARHPRGVTAERRELAQRRGAP